ncbi:hypothetical protein GCM10019059_44930 [Camelimonas fluminis]|uniref:DUF3572 family protein n=1 Tax=Camelimonas fluminis TaxID=1576911 RepID=A0ABV7UGU7_9HYPH|nr:hypothetical protein [Camelimonas fluminis]GHE82463.1 hypothetical protein GCM10019059_44930 [Camelimonas fluminis]
MTYEERAQILATINGWHVDQDGNFACILGCDVPDVVTNIAPTDPAAWGMLCEMEGIDVPHVLDYATIAMAHNMNLTAARPRAVQSAM